MRVVPAGAVTAAAAETGGAETASAAAADASENVSGAAAIVEPLITCAPRGCCCCCSIAGWIHTMQENSS